MPAIEPRQWRACAARCRRPKSQARQAELPADDRLVQALQLLVREEMNHQTSAMAAPKQTHAGAQCLAERILEAFDIRIDRRLSRADPVGIHVARQRLGIAHAEMVPDDALVQAYTSCFAIGRQAR